MANKTDITDALAGFLGLKAQAKQVVQDPTRPDMPWSNPKPKASKPVSKEWFDHLRREAQKSADAALKREKRRPKMK